MDAGDHDSTLLSTLIEQEKALQRVALRSLVQSEQVAYPPDDITRSWPYAKLNLYRRIQPIIQSCHQLELRRKHLRQRVQDIQAARDRLLIMRGHPEADAIAQDSVLANWTRQALSFSLNFRHQVVLGNYSDEETGIHLDLLCSNVQCTAVESEAAVASHLGAEYSSQDKVASGAATEDFLRFTTRRDRRTFTVTLRYTAGVLSSECDLHLVDLQPTVDKFLTLGYPFDAFVRLGVWSLVDRMHE